MARNHWHRRGRRWRWRWRWRWRTIGWIAAARTHSLTRSVCVAEADGNVPTFFLVARILARSAFSLCRCNRTTLKEDSTATIQEAYERGITVEEEWETE